MRILTAILVIGALAQVLCEDSNTYKAAVVEYFPKKIDGNLNEVVEGRTNEYIEILSKIGEKLDIIVYPESTLLTGVVVSQSKLIEEAAIVEVEDVPCANEKNHQKYFVNLSCAAKNHKTYLSVNLLEKVKCEGEKCPHGWWMYNTNVVFDRTGKIVASYRKLNLFGENVEVPKPMRTTFTTDFGVTFGMFICFDIMFKEPALEVVNQGVKHFLYPTMWFSELPFLSAVQTQYMWSYENDVVLLASGANNPKKGSGGSGIYQGRKGPLTTYMSDKEGTKVLIADVEKVWKYSEDNEIVETSKEVEDVDGLLLIYDKLEYYNTYNLDVQQREYRFKISEDFECNFKVEARNTEVEVSKKSYHYKLVAYSGERSFSGVATGNVQACSILTCTDESLKNCGHRILKNEDTYPIKFDRIEIEMKVKENENSKQFPNAIYSNLKPLGSRNVDWKENGRSKVISLKTPGEPFITFGIFGRVF
ncbi:PREDICTED: vanin-like protein 1 [Nicrophorus vespilloides]|uniref:Vanin-like protein 1 n=1 Tax=Nicrophorus vespilloides TaxID=110193 RepID=A0ABM1N549_NICVS|nr:PREDICTED: vanin-like protein 1 [Nicrophorus vespilloides]